MRSAAVRARRARTELLRLKADAEAAERAAAPMSAPELTATSEPERLSNARTSTIDTTVPVFGNPTTASVRNNFAAAKNDIEALQAEKLDLTGGVMSGNIVLAPTQRLDGGIFGSPRFSRR